MGTEYAVIKNVTLRQSKRNRSATVLVTRGSLVLDGCEVLSELGPCVSIIGNEAEPVFRRSRFFSVKNVAILNQSNGKVLLEDCHLSSHSDVSVVFIADGNPVFRHCTLTGNPGYGVFVEENGKGTFEECNIYGFDYSPAIGIDGGNPSFIRCKIHDGLESGVAIHQGKGVFQDCTLFGFGKELPAVRVSQHSQPRFQHCTIKNCQGGAFLFEEEAGGIVESCDLFGFIHKPAVTIRSEAQPQFLRSRIHDGNYEAVVSYDAGKGLMESCDLYGFNGNIVSVIHSGKLDLLRCKIYNGNEHGIYMAQKGEGIIKDTEVYLIPRKAALHVTQAADPLFVHCRVYDSLLGAEIKENGRGTFEQCSFKGLKQTVWDIHESQPVIRHCKEEDGREVDVPVNNNDAIAFSEPVYRLFTELDEVIGQEQVKETLREVVLYLDYLQDRKRLGFKTTEPLNIHALFTGPPDTGKLRVAELYGQIMKEMGFLNTGQVVIAGSTDMIHEEKATTGKMVKQYIQEAKGGILYLHHLHLLTPGRWPFDSVQVLLDHLQQILNQEEPELAIIIAGPEPETAGWINSYPQIAGKLKHHYVFTDYSPEEMAVMLERIAADEDYHVHPAAMPTLQKEMRRLWNKPGPKSKAARVKEYFQKVKVVHSRRCSKLPKQERTREMLTTFLSEDLSVKEQSDIQPGDHSWLKELKKH
nr:right-handed parallel beta-helix repeat-containing protein [Paenactinomyces guangxiensis]